MEENLAANSRDFATPEGAANIREDAPLPTAATVTEKAAPARPEAAPTETAFIGALTNSNSKEWTRKVAQRIKEERQKAQSELIEELFGDEEACREYRERREREQAAETDLAESAMFAGLALAADPELGEHYLALEEEVLALSGQYGTDVESAFLLVLRQHLPRLLREERHKGEQDLLSRLSANAATPGSLAEAAAPAMGLYTLNDQEFASMVARVKRGEFKT